MSDMGRFHTRLNSIRKHAEKELAKFQETFNKYPLSAFIWSNSAFQAAARLQVIKDVDNAIENGFLEDIRDNLLRQLHIDVQQPSCSTSMTSNCAQQHLNAARSEMIEIIDAQLQAQTR